MSGDEFGGLRSAERLARCRASGLSASLPGRIAPAGTDKPGPYARKVQQRGKRNPRRRNRRNRWLAAGETACSPPSAGRFGCRRCQAPRSRTDASPPRLSWGDAVLGYLLVFDETVTDADDVDLIVTSYAATLFALTPGQSADRPGTRLALPGRDRRLTGQRALPGQPGRPPQGSHPRRRRYPALLGRGGGGQRPVSRPAESA